MTSSSFDAFDAWSASTSIAWFMEAIYKFFSKHSASGDAG